MIVELIIILIVLAIAVWLLDKYVVPILPAPIGRIVLALIIIIVVIFLLNKYLGLGL